MASSGIPELDHVLGSEYPDKSTILVTGPTGIEKEAIGYKFAFSASIQSDLCLYVTTLSVSEVSQDFRAFGIDINPAKLVWFAREGGDLKFQNDLAKVSFEIKEILKKNPGRKIRIVLDVLSALLMLNSPETVYRFLDQLLPEVKQYNTILVATLEGGMHQPQVVASIEQLFDGVLELKPRVNSEGQQIGTLLQIKKMRGVSLKDSARSMVFSQQKQNASDLVISGVSFHEKNRIAVLPFSNISPDRADEYFANGLTDELISRLSVIAGLRIIARTSVLGYAGTIKRIPVIGKELGVGSILEGSVRKAGNSLRITVQLVDASSEERLWSGVYNREILNIFSVQAEVAENVAKALKVKLTNEELSRVERQETQSISAYVLYLQGREKLGEFSGQGFNEALTRFKMATLEDPHYASAFAGMALCYAAMGGWGFSHPEISYRSARETIDRALELDSEIAEAHAAFGRLLYYHDFDYKHSENEFKKAIELNPSYAFAHYGYAICLTLLGKLSEAISELDMSLSLDPLSPLTLFTKASVLFHMGRQVEASELLQEGKKLYPSTAMGYAIAGTLAASQSRLAEAMKSFEEALRLDPVNLIASSGLGFCYAISGQVDKATELIENLERSAEKVSSAGFIAIIYAGLNDSDKFFKWMDRAIDERGMNAFYLIINPLILAMKQDPRFQQALHKMNVLS
jgi:TolB-like protein/KaiC/GvpD/RAD55 family RecA-like ATPase/Tfp pilus assembly protein PilF